MDEAILIIWNLSKVLCSFNFVAIATNIIWKVKGIFIEYSMITNLNSTIQSRNACSDSFSAIVSPTFMLQVQYR